MHNNSDNIVAEPICSRVKSQSVSNLHASPGGVSRSPGQAVPRQAAGGHASTTLVRLPPDALTAVAPSSHGRPAFEEHTYDVVMDRL